MATTKTINFDGVFTLIAARKIRIMMRALKIPGRIELVEAKTSGRYLIMARTRMGRRTAVRRFEEAVLTRSQWMFN